MPDYRSNNGFYNFDHLSTIVFCVNTDLEKELGLTIKGYKDLLNPVLKGRIVLSDPNSSSAACPQPMCWGASKAPRRS